MDLAQLAAEQAQLRTAIYDQELALQRLDHLPVAEAGAEQLEAYAKLHELRTALAVLEQKAESATELLKDMAATEEAESTAAQQTKPRRVRRGMSGESISRSVSTHDEETHIDVTINLPRVPISVYNILDVQTEPLITVSFRHTMPAGPAKQPRFKDADSAFSGRLNVKGRRRYRVRSSIEHFSSTATTLIDLLPGEQQDVRQLPTLIPERVQNVNELTRATLHLTIEWQKNVDSAEWLLADEISEPIWLLAKSSAPQAVRNPTTGEWNDLTRFLGAFVTPNDPDVIAFLRTAADHHPDVRLDGYQSSVRSQAAAIYAALKAHGIVYVDSVLDFNPGAQAHSQRVRLPRESLRDRLANCIDGVVLFASLMQGISVNPCIAVLPRHAIVGWETKLGSGRWHYLETTMLSTHEFEKAVEVGTRQVEAYEQRFNDTGDPAWFRRWSLRDLRAEYGIMPMG